MFRLGEYQELEVVKFVDFGVYLSENPDAEEKVLLPKKQVPQGTEIGQKIKVFLYKDSDDRLIATTMTPKLTVGEVAPLLCKDTGRIGAFMDMGLAKDVLLPFHEQTKKVKKGDTVLCTLYVDKSERLAVKMNVYEYLSTDSPYKKDDRVTGMIYEDSDNFGLFVAVDNKYSALIPKREIYGKIGIGDVVEARVSSVREDGKLTLSLREKAYVQMDTDAERLLREITMRGGELALNDKSDPESIRNTVQMSKNEFKRAVGRLLKQEKIRFTENGIALRKENS